MKAREYLILEQCIDNGIKLGWSRAHKHRDDPTPDQIQEDVAAAVMQEIAEYFIFDQEGE